MIPLWLPFPRTLTANISYLTCPLLPSDLATALRSCWFRSQRLQFSTALYGNKLFSARSDFIRLQSTSSTIAADRFTLAVANEDPARYKCIMPPCATRASRSCRRADRNCQVKSAAARTLPRAAGNLRVLGRRNATSQRKRAWHADPTSAGARQKRPRVGWHVRRCKPPSCLPH